MRAESNAIVVAIQLGVGAALSIVADPFDELRERQRCLAEADIKSNVLKENPCAHDGAGVGSTRSFLHYGPKQS
jgi:hypothetical protein